jgi:hypothetical protein
MKGTGDSDRIEKHPFISSMGGGGGTLQRCWVDFPRVRGVGVDSVDLGCGVCQC